MVEATFLKSVATRSISRRPPTPPPRTDGQRAHPTVTMKNNLLLLLLCLLSTLSYRCWGLIPLIDGGKGMPSESNVNVIHDDLQHNFSSTYCKCYYFLCHISSRRSHIIAVPIKHTHNIGTFTTTTNQNCTMPILTIRYPNRPARPYLVPYRRGNELWKFSFLQFRMSKRRSSALLSSKFCNAISIYHPQ